MNDNVDLLVRLRWYCGLYVGDPKWHGTERYEPSECEHEFETTEPREEWEEGLCSVTCPACGGTLSAADDHATLIESNDQVERPQKGAKNERNELYRRRHCSALPQPVGNGIA